mgnify:CR=1 FL=1
MRLFLTGWIILFTSAVDAQNKSDSTFIFRGYIFSEDSVPVESAHLINYRNTKIVTTNSTGYFSVSVQKGDSLMINHLSMQPLVIHSNKKEAVSNIFYVTYRSYQIQTIFSNYNIEQYYFEQNIKRIRQSLQQSGLQHIKSPRGSDNNPYNPDKTSLGLTTTPGDIFKLFKKKK